MKEKIANSIFQHQQTIHELKEIKTHLEDAIPGSIKFIMKSGQFLGMDIFTRTDTIKISDNTMGLILDKAIEKERERIDKLIDMEIERRMKEE